MKNQQQQALEALRKYNQGLSSPEDFLAEAEAITGDISLTIGKPSQDQISRAYKLLGNIIGKGAETYLPFEYKYPSVGGLPNYLVIKLTPSSIATESEKDAAYQDTALFKTEVKSVIEKLTKDEEIENPQVKASALLFYSKGVPSHELEKLLEENKKLSKEERAFFVDTIKIIKGLEVNNPEQTMLLQTAADFPTIELTTSHNYESLPIDSEDHIILRSDEYVLTPTPIIPPTQPPALQTYSDFTSTLNFAEMYPKGPPPTSAAETTPISTPKPDLKTSAPTEPVGAQAAPALTKPAGIFAKSAGLTAGSVIDSVGKRSFKIVNSAIEKVTGEKDPRKRAVYIGAGTALLGLSMGMPLLAGAGVLGTVAAGFSPDRVVENAKGIAGLISIYLSGLARALLMLLALTVATLVGVLVFVAFAMLIINSGAYLTPPGALTGTAPPGPGPIELPSPYIGVTKAARLNTDAPGTGRTSITFDNADLPVTVTYDITISATQDTLTNVTLDYYCLVVKLDNTSPPCPTAPTLPQVPGGTVPAGSPFEFSYSITYTDVGTTFDDALVADTIVVTADVPNHTSITSSAFANTIIGNPPLAGTCPLGGIEITSQLASTITGGVVHLLPESLGARNPSSRLCITPTMIVMHWSAGPNDDPDGNTATYNTLVSRDRACQLGTDTNDVELWQPYYQTQVEMAWCANSWNTYSINNEMAGVYFTDTPPPPNLQELDLAYGATCELMRQYNIPWCRIFGHYQVPGSGGKIDPGQAFLENVFIPEIRNRCPNDPFNVCP